MNRLSHLIKLYRRQPILILRQGLLSRKSIRNCKGLSRLVNQSEVKQLNEGCPLSHGVLGRLADWIIYTRGRASTWSSKCWPQRTVCILFKIFATPHNSSLGWSEYQDSAQVKVKESQITGFSQPSGSTCINTASATEETWLLTAAT